MSKEISDEVALEVRNVCAAVNASPILQSLLYDIDLLPEQTSGNGPAWAKTVAVVNHWAQQHAEPIVGVNCWGKAYDRENALRGALGIARKALTEKGDESTAALIDATLKNSAEQATPIPRSIIDVMDERERQRRVHHWTAEHDDEHDSGDLAMAAASYCIAAADVLSPLAQGDGSYAEQAPSCWPWEEAAWKVGPPRRMLVKAVALGLAEIEREDRRLARIEAIAKERSSQDGRP